MQHRSYRVLAMHILWLMRLIALLPLVGCAWFGDSSQRTEMLSIPEMQDTLRHAGQDEVFNGQWPTQDWWQAFNDDTLSGLIETALAANPDLKAAEARLRQAQALVDARGAELYPTVNAHISFSAQRFSANSVQAKLAGESFRSLLLDPFVLRYHLDFWGRDQAALQAAVGRALATAAETAEARLLLAVSVAGAYFDLQAASYELSLSVAMVADHETLAKLERTRLALGLAGEAPALQAKIGLYAAKQLQARLQADVERHRHLLATLAGKGPDWGQGIKIEDVAALQVPLLPDDIPLRLLSRRPDLSAARLYAEAAAEQIKVAKTAFYPDVNLLAFTGLHSVSLTDVLLQGSSLAYAVGPSIDFPIFEGGRLRANLSHQEAAYDAAVERYNASLLRAVQEVADALSRRREIETRLSAQRQTLQDAETNKRLQQTLARAGLSDQRKPLQARLEVNQVCLVLAELLAEQRKAAVRISKALGGGYDAGIPTRYTNAQ